MEPALLAIWKAIKIDHDRSDSNEIDHDRSDSNEMYHIHFDANEHEVIEVAPDLVYPGLFLISLGENTKSLFFSVKPFFLCGVL